MTDHDEERPRRAFPSDDATHWEHQPAEGSSPGTPATADEPGGTPIPPPAVLPGAGETAGARRSSAEDLPGDTDEASLPRPRRSALSPSDWDEDEDDDPVEPEEPDGRVPAGGASGATVADTPTRPLLPRQGRRTAPWLIGGAVAVVGAIVAGSLLLGEAGLVPTPTPTPTVDPVDLRLLHADDLAGLRADTTWNVASTDTQLSAGTPQPTCLAAPASTEPEASETFVRTFAPTSADAPGGLLQQVDGYPSEAEASAAFAERVTELGACARNTALLISGWSVTGLADASTAATFVFQDTEDEYHTFVLAQTGALVNIVDATQPDEAPDVLAVASVLGNALARQCTQGGECPTEVAVADAAPPPTEPFGWLAGVDLPRLTPGAGSWRGTEMPALRVVGTRCENVDLTAVPSVTEAQQRTYLLAEDPGIPAGFGVDEVIYRFASAEEAAAFSAGVASAIDGCPERTATAQVTRVTDLTGAGTGAAWTVTQQTDETATATFRVSVQAVGDRVVYLMANPTDGVDFSDAGWGQVSVRAAQRVTQLPEPEPTPDPTATAEGTASPDTASPEGTASPDSETDEGAAAPSDPTAAATP